METVKERMEKLELSLGKRLEMASVLVRQYTYSITTTTGKKHTKENVLELRNEKLEELMKLLEG